MTVDGIAEIDVPSTNVLGGRVVAGVSVVLADLHIRAGRIHALVENGGSLPIADQVIDARGCFVLPGGVDPHTHIFPDPAAATRAAASGGTTTALSFTAPSRAEPDILAFRRARSEIAGVVNVDVGLHAAIWKPSDLTAAVLTELGELGVSGVKLYLAYSELGMQARDNELFAALEMTRALGMTVQVHCESDAIVTGLMARHIAAGLVGPKDFVASRPARAEEEAIDRALAIAAATEAPIYITHITTGGGLRLIEQARARGQIVWAECCLPHLLLTADSYERADASRFLLAPPLREASQVDQLWAGIKGGVVDAVGTDHSQTRFVPGPDEGGFVGLPYGLAGIEVRLPLLLSRGIERGLSLPRLVSVLSEGPAKAFGHFPRKGCISPGSDADLVIWDPASKSVITNEDLTDATVDCPYLGMPVTGRVRDVLLRGRILLVDGEVTESGTWGRYASSPIAELVGARS